MLMNLLIVPLIAGLAAIGQSYFVYRYARYSTWRGDQIGRALMVKSASLAILMVIAVLNEFLFVTENDTIIALGNLFEVLAYLGVTVGVFWQLSVLLKSQHGELNQKTPGEPPETESGTL